MPEPTEAMVEAAARCFGGYPNGHFEDDESCRQSAYEILKAGLAVSPGCRGAGHWPPDWWWHEKHGLHDEAHHQHHSPLDLCVPLNDAEPPPLASISSDEELLSIPVPGCRGAELAEAAEQLLAEWEPAKDGTHTIVPDKRLEALREALAAFRASGEAEWRCPHCGRRNARSESTCYLCGDASPRQASGGVVG